VRKEDLKNPDVVRYINNLLAEKGSGITEDAGSIYSNLGRGVGVTHEERDDSNKDPFRLMRDKGQM
jgi:hypothetical protein